MQTKKLRVNDKLMNPKDENEIIGPRKSNEVSNSPWECRVSKRDEETQRKQTAKDAQEKKQKGHRSP